MRQRHLASIWLAFTLIPVLVTCLLWAPFGFTLHGLIEEWDVLGLFAESHVFFAATPHSLLPAHSLRPFTILPQAIGYFLDPDSFVFWHLQMMLALVLKGVATAFLVWFATRKAGPAVVASALVILYPADTMQLAFRSLHISVALSLALVGACASVAAYGAVRRRWIVLGGLTGAALFAFACAMYEATLALFVLPWLVLFARDGAVAVRLALRHWLLGLAWCAGLAVYLVYATWASAQVHSYQSSLVGGGSIFFTSLPNLFRVGAVRGLLGGWVDAYKMLAREYANYVYLAISSLILLAAVGFAVKVLRRTDPPAVDAPLSQSRDDQQARWRLIRLLFIGVVLMLVGYAPYLMSPSHQIISQRTFLFATPGAVMAWTGAVGLIGLVRPRAMADGITGLLLILGLGAQLYQFHHYVHISREQDRLLRGIIDAVGPMPADKTLVVLDGMNVMGQTWMFHEGPKLNSALTYFYGHALSRVEICREAAWEWQRADDIGRKGTCSIDNASMRMHWPEPVNGPGAPMSAAHRDQVLPQSALVIVSLDEQGRARRLSPAEPGIAPLRERYLGVLADVSDPWGDRMFRDSTPRQSAESPFGKYWSMEVPVRGSGWREPEWKVGLLRHVAMTWKTSPVATLYLDILPSGKTYEASGNVEAVARRDMREKIALRMNGTPLALVWVDATHFRAEIPASAMRLGRNAVEFEAPVAADYYGLSFALDSFRVRPLR